MTTAAANPPAEPAGELIDVEIDRIDTDVSNHRLHEDADRIRELAESIDQNGLQQPIRVYLKRNGSTKNVRFTLGFGFRRLAACRQLKRKTIRAFVFPPAAEDQIRTAQAIENLHREDLTPLEETTAVEAIVQSLRARGPEVYDEKTATATCAAMIGRPRKWVESRLALTRLSPRVRQLLTDGEIYLGHAQLLAQLASYEDQEEIAGRVKAFPVRNNWHQKPVKGDKHPPKPIAETRYLVQERMRSLERVNWSLDVEFAGKPACARCPENAANAPGLFDGDQPRKPLCLNAACYATKAKQAQSAMQRASNTLAKMEVKPTPAQARKAMAERQVEFINPRIVAEHAKRKKAPKTATPAEKRGAKTAKKIDAVDEKYRKAVGQWEDSVAERVLGLLRANPWRVAIMVLLREATSFRWAKPTDLPKSKKREHIAWRKVEPFIRGLANEAGLKDLFARFVRELGDEFDPQGWNVDDAYSEGDFSADLWLEVFPDVLEAVGPKPRKEQFQAEPTKPAEPAATPKKKRRRPTTPKAAAPDPAEDTSTGTIELAPELLKKLAESGDLLALGEGKAKGPFKHDGALWCKVGAVSRGGGWVLVIAYRLIPAEQYCGKACTPTERMEAVRQLEAERLYVSAEQLRGEHEGDRVQYRGKPHVLTGRTTFIPAPAPAAKGGVA